MSHFLRTTALISSVILSVSAMVCKAESDGSLALKTVVIDAGHGGKDAGSISKNGKVYEKTLNLKIATYVAEGIVEACPDVKVILTRKDDRYLTLGQRAEVANSKNADLFISIHINSVKNTSANGFSVHVLGQSKKKDTDLFAYNMDVCKRENSVILLEDDYSTKYQGFDPNDPQSFIFFSLMQNAHLAQSLDFAEDIEKEFRKGPIRTSRGVWQDPFYLLWKTTMPAVLIECGFISNAEDLKVMSSEEGQKAIAGRITAAFVKFKHSYDSSVKIDSDSAQTSDAVSKAQDTSSSDRSVNGVSNQATETATPNSSNTVKNTSNTIKSNALAKPSEKSSEQTDSPVGTAVKYGVQIFTLSRTLPEGDSRLLGYKPTVIPSGSSYKYIIGTSATRSESESKLAEIRRKYPDSYLVKIENGIATRIK